MPQDTGEGAPETLGLKFKGGRRPADPLGKRAAWALRTAHAAALMQPTVTTDYLAKYCILSDDQLERYGTVFKAVDLDRDGTISMTELEFGLRAQPIAACAASGLGTAHPPCATRHREPAHDLCEGGILCQHCARDDSIHDNHF